MAEVELTYELALEFLSFLRVQVHTEPGDGWVGPETWKALTA